MFASGKLSVATVALGQHLLVRIPRRRKVFLLGGSIKLTARLSNGKAEPGPFGRRFFGLSQQQQIAAFRENQGIRLDRLPTLFVGWRLGHFGFQPFVRRLKDILHELVHAALDGHRVGSRWRVVSATGNLATGYPTWQDEQCRRDGSQQRQDEKACAMQSASLRFLRCRSKFH